MKKLIAICLLIITILSFTGCAAGSVPTVPAENSVKLSELKKVDTKDKDTSKAVKAFRDSDLYNMCTELNKGGHVSDGLVLTNAEVIGAVTGCRFSENVNSSPINIEIYQFDTDKLSDTGKAVVNSVKENGNFQVFDKTVYNASMSKNGKYMIVYTDGKTEGDNPGDENVERKNNVMKIFNSAK